MHGFLILPLSPHVCRAGSQTLTLQDLPLQHAFQSGMESLLGARSPINKKTMSIDAVLERTEATARDLHPSTGVERDEEQRWDANIGQGGAFGNRAAQGSREGVERTVWEFRDEEMVLAERVAERAARESVKSKGGVARARASARTSCPQDQTRVALHHGAVWPQVAIPIRGHIGSSCKGAGEAWRSQTQINQSHCYDACMTRPITSRFSRKRTQVVVRGPLNEVQAASV
jgi:hypothetical protein